MRANYMNKENRDKALKNMLPEEKKRHKKSSIRNQLLHPMYILDYEKETGIVLTEADKGFGNTIYKTQFAAIYSIEERNPHLWDY